VFLDTGHRKLFWTLLEELLARFGIETHTYCLTDNQYHLLLRTPEGNLNRGMRHLNSV
jgi:putative transposase